jgi:subtilisin family serine protease
MEQEYIVSLNEGINYGEFWFEMETSTPGATYVPDRAVDIINERPGSQRCCHYSLTEEEASTLRNDPRVRDVELSPLLRDDIEIGRWSQQNSIFNKSSSDSGSYVNWGLLRCAFDSNIYGANTTTNQLYNFHLDGTGVDVVISDSGLQVDHPEFTDATGVSRVQQIDWASASGLSFTQNANHYRDYDGHGTHVAGIAAGKTYGWAKNARVYSIKVNGLEGAGDSGTGINIFQTQDAIKLWHLAKPLDPATGKRRPTVVNMSWGYSSSYTSITSGNYRGTGWTATDGNSNSAALRLQNYGIQGTFYRIPSRQSWLDTDIDELTAAGVIVCIAAGNTPYKAEASTGPDYNNYFIGSSGVQYYHRGSSPLSVSNGCFMVGNLDSTTYSASQERAVASSTRGPTVNVWAPGTNIMSCTSQVNRWGTGSQPYYLNSAYKQTNIGGTSMASPQVCGIVALYLQANPGATPREVTNFITKSSKNTVYTTNTSTDYNQTYSLLGSPNLTAYMPFSANVGQIIEARLGE